MTVRTISVQGGQGSGKKTLIGSLVHKCELELSQVEALERKGIQSFAGIATFYREHDKPISFHTLSGPVVVDGSQTADIALWLVDAQDQAGFSQSVQQLIASLSSGFLRTRSKLIVLVNMMDKVDWSEAVFKNAVDAFNAVATHTRTFMIPISSLGGENLLTTPLGPSWIKDLPNNSSGDERSIRTSSQPLIDLLG